MAVTDADREVPEQSEPEKTDPSEPEAPAHLDPDPEVPAHHEDDESTVDGADPSPPQPS